MTVTTPDTRPQAPVRERLRSLIEHPAAQRTIIALIVIAEIPAKTNCPTKLKSRPHRKV